MGSDNEDDDDSVGYIMLEDLEGETESDRTLHAAKQLDEIAQELTGDPHLAAVALAHALGRCIGAGGTKEPLEFYLDYVKGLAEGLSDLVKKNVN